MSADDKDNNPIVAALRKMANAALTHDELLTAFALLARAESSSNISELFNQVRSMHGREYNKPNQL